VVERVVKRCVFSAAPGQPKRGKETSCYHKGHDGNIITRVFFYISRGYPMSIYGGRLFVVSARTNKKRLKDIIIIIGKRQYFANNTADAACAAQHSFAVLDQVVSYARERARGCSVSIPAHFASILAPRTPIRKGKTN
jgi:hypothetical protein